MTEPSEHDGRKHEGRTSVNFRQAFVSGGIDESFLAQVVDFALSTLSLSLFHHYINGPDLSPPKTALRGVLRGRERPLTKVSDERGVAGGPPSTGERKESRNKHIAADPMPRSAPTVVFISERKHGQSQNNLAFFATGRNRTTGQITVGVSIRCRRNGLAHFGADLWRLDYDLGPVAISRLHRRWHDLNAAHNLSKKVLRKMNCHFSTTVVEFDATAEQVGEWKDILTALLSKSANYIYIAGRDRLERTLEKWR